LGWIIFNTTHVSLKRPTQEVAEHSIETDKQDTSDLFKRLSQK